MALMGPEHALPERLEILEDIYRAEEQLARGEGVSNREAEARIQARLDTARSPR